MKAPAYLAVNPMGKVPAIRHGDTVVTEGAAICAYLADAFPQAGLAPPHGDRARGPYYRWLFFGAGPVEAAASAKSMGWEAPDKSVQLGYGSFALVLEVLEKAVSASDYLAGDKFSAADVYTGSHIGWGMQFGTLEKRPAFERYWQRVTNRPAYARGNEIDNKLAAEHPMPSR
jgi:glutathione S-transferase